MLSRILKRSTSAPKGVARRGGASAGPFVESLEARQLYDVTASLNTSTHILTVTGDANNNTISVYQDGSSQLWVDVNGGGSDLGPWNVGDVNLVRVNGGGGAETLIAEGSDSGLTYGSTAVSKPFEFYGNYGNDTIWGGNGNDMVDGGNDNDSLRGGPGSDTMYGANGADVLRGDWQNDSASDSMYGGAGMDTFYAFDSGFDYIDGGADSDDANANESDTILNVP